MNGYDIGLKPIVASATFDTKMKHKKFLRLHWACDIFKTLVLADIVPVFDANMMRIYAYAYRKDLEGVPVDKLTEMASAYHQAISTFVYQNVFGHIARIVNRWKTYVESCSNSNFSIPTNCLNHFNNLLQIHKLDPNVDDTIQFNAFISSIMQNSVEWFQIWDEDFDVSKYIVPKERVLEYIGIVEKKLNDCFKTTNANDSIAIDYKTKITHALEHIKALLLMFHQVKVTNREDMLQLIKKDFVIKYHIDREMRAAADEFARKYTKLSMNHIVCIQPDMDIPLEVESELSDPVSDPEEYQFLYGLYIQSHTKQEDL